MPTKTRVLALAAVAALLAVAGSTGVASAGLDSIEVVSDQTPRNTKSPKTAKVTCPNGTFMSGGGAVVLNGRTSVALQSASREKQGRWAATAFRVKSYSLPWRLRVQAFCITS